MTGKKYILIMLLTPYSMHNSIPLLHAVHGMYTHMDQTKTQNTFYNKNIRAREMAHSPMPQEKPNKVKKNLERGKKNLAGKNLYRLLHKKIHTQYKKFRYM